MDQRVAVIGAGLGGMAAAYDLAKAGKDVTIFEAAGHVGGLAAGFKEPHWDWTVEKFYHHWFASDSHMLGLIKELGLDDQVLFLRPYTVMYHKGKFYPFDSILAALLYPGLGWGINKIRFGLVGLFLRLSTNWKVLETTTVDAWMRKWAGKKVYEQMWQPMLIGKFGETFSSQVNMAWLWARLHVRTTQLGTFKGGFQRFADLFAERLQEMGVTIELNTPIVSIQPSDLAGVDMQVKGEKRRFDQCLVTTSPALLAKIAPSLPEDYLKGLLALKSMGAVVMILSLNQPLSTDGYYWYNIPKSAGFPFLSLVEHTNFITSAHYGGDNLVYIGDYLEVGHEYYNLTPKELLQRFIPGIQCINPQFKESWVSKVWVNSTNYAQPVPTINHSRNIPTIETPIHGLFFASMSQVYPWDRGTNFAVEIGRRAVRLMMHRV